MVVPGRLAAVVFASIAVSAGLVAAPAANARPLRFPDIDSYPAVDLDEYQVMGAHPSMSGWVFSTPGGLKCQDSMIADLGVSCSGPIVGTRPPMNSVGVSLRSEGQFRYSDNESDDGHPYPLVAVGSKIAPANGVVCAVLTDEALACRAKKPDSWPKDTPDPPDRHYGEHGFVVQPSGSWAY